MFFSSSVFTFHVLLFEKLNDQTTIWRLRKIKWQCYWTVRPGILSGYIESHSVFSGIE